MDTRSDFPLIAVNAAGSSNMAWNLPWAYALPEAAGIVHENPEGVRDYAWHLQTDTGYCTDPSSDPGSGGGSRGSFTFGDDDDGGPGPGGGTSYC